MPETEYLEAIPLSNEEIREEKFPLKKGGAPASNNGAPKLAHKVPVANPGTVEIDIKLDDKPKDPKTTFNFRKPTFTGDILKGKTESEVINPPNDPARPKPSNNVDDIRAQMVSEEASEANKMTYEDYEDTADFLVDLVDMALVFGIRWMSLDTTDAPYEVPKEKVAKLKKHLTRLLIRQNKKFPMGMLLLIAILAAYGTPFRKALEHRKLVMAEKAKKKKQQQLENPEPETSTESSPLKKKRGAQNK